MIGKRVGHRQRPADWMILTTTPLTNFSPSRVDTHRPDAATKGSEYPRPSSSPSSRDISVARSRARLFGAAARPAAARNAHDDPRQSTRCTHGRGLNSIWCWLLVIGRSIRRSIEACSYQLEINLNLVRSTPSFITRGARQQTAARGRCRIRNKPASQLAHTTSGRSRSRRSQEAL